MAEATMYYTVEGVEALYPRINTTYKFDNKANGGKGGSVKCDPLDDGAAYEMSFVMSEPKAKALFKAMKAATTLRKKQAGPTSFRSRSRRTTTVTMSVKQN